MWISDAENKMINSVEYGGKFSLILFLLSTVFILAAELKGGK